MNQKEKEEEAIENIPSSQGWKKDNRSYFRTHTSAHTSHHQILFTTVCHLLFFFVWRPNLIFIWIIHASLLSLPHYFQFASKIPCSDMAVYKSSFIEHVFIWVVHILFFRLNKRSPIYRWLYYYIFPSFIFPLILALSLSLSRLIFVCGCASILFLFLLVPFAHFVSPFNLLLSSVR